MAAAGEPARPDPLWVGDIQVRMLAPSESARLCDAVRTVYGETYPVLWAYDADEVARRISGGLLISAIAETADGELLCHSGLSLAAPDDVVGHAGQALTLPAARGQHIFTTVKRYLVEWATSQGLVGMYSEATASHPYSQQALLDLGGHETGFLLGFIPQSVDNSVSAPSPGRQSAALFFLRVRPGRNGWSMHRAAIGRSCATPSRSVTFGPDSPKRRSESICPRARNATRRLGPVTMLPS